MITVHHWEGPLEDAGEPAKLAPEHEPPRTAGGRENEWVGDHDTQTRDVRPALGTRGEAGAWTASAGRTSRPSLTRRNAPRPSSRT